MANSDISVVSEWETTSSALTTVDVNIFRHEFITIFRWSHQMTVHPNDIRILEPIDEQSIRYEEENGTVFMAKDVMERLRKNFMGRKAPMQGQPQQRRSWIYLDYLWLIYGSWGHVYLHLWSRTCLEWSFEVAMYGPGAVNLSQSVANPFSWCTYMVYDIWWSPWPNPVGPGSSIWNA